MANPLNLMLVGSTLYGVTENGGANGLGTTIQRAFDRRLAEYDGVV